MPTGTLGRRNYRAETLGRYIHTYLLTIYNNLKLISLESMTNTYSYSTALMIYDISHLFLLLPGFEACSRQQSPTPARVQLNSTKQTNTF